MCGEMIQKQVQYGDLEVQKGHAGKDQLFQCRTVATPWHNKTIDEWERLWMSVLIIIKEN
jgi:hypothetical protein